MSSKALSNLLREDDIDDVDIEVANLAAQQYGLSQAIVRAESNQNDIGAYLGAAQDKLKELKQTDAANWIGEAWARIEENFHLLTQQDIINTGLNEANRKLLEQRNTAVYERAQIDKAIAEGRSDDPALRSMLRQMEVETYYVVWTSIDDTICKLFPQVSQGAVHSLLNALSGGVSMTNAQAEALLHLLAQFEEMAAAS